MKILVIGPEHSGSRFVVALLKRHPSVSKVFHRAYPWFYGKWPDIKSIVKENSSTEEPFKIVIVSRDRSINELSMRKPSGDGHVSRCFRSILSGTEYTRVVDYAHDKILSDLNDLSFSSYESRVVVSFEGLINYREQYLYQIFKLLELEPTKYSYGFKDAVMTPSGRINLRQYDANRKYVEKDHI